jgi:RimJ/RimL family protein N-acetyltransferase
MSDIREAKFWKGLLNKIAKIVLKNLGVRTSPPTHNQHVVPHEEGWAVKGEGNVRYTGTYKYQSDAIDRATKIAKNYNSDVIIHIIIRPANSEDIPTLLRFEQGVVDAERPFDSTLRTTNVKYYDLDQMIDSKDVHLVVANSSDIIVGSGYARIEKAKPYLKHEYHAYLGFMFVEETQRGNGIVLKIIKELEDWAKSRGIKEVRLDVFSNNSSAIRAYMKSGFSKHLVEMRKSLE